MKASQLTLEGNISILLKGSPGFGKTIAACSFAELGPVYLAYFDKMRPVELLTYFSKHRPALLDRIEYDVYGSNNIGDYILKLESFKDRGTSNVAIITDSLTQLTASAVNWSMAYNDSKKQNVKNAQVKPEMSEYQVETGLVGKALDILKGLPVYNIWTAHPLAGIQIEGAGNSIKVTKTNPLVSYGTKVASMVPGHFTEIYHIGKVNTWDNATGTSSSKRIVYTEAVGDELAKSSLGLPKEFDITNKLFYEVWRDALKSVKLGG